MPAIAMLQESDDLRLAVSNVLPINTYDRLECGAAVVGLRSELKNANVAARPQGRVLCLRSRWRADHVTSCW